MEIFSGRCIILKITGVICEYNPLHLGHKKQLDIIRTKDPDTGIVCLMSGNYVQRGAPAVFDKTIRAKAAILCGADLVLELPVNASLSSAEGFAYKSVAILSPFCDMLSFGAETADASLLMQIAETLLSDDFPAKLHAELDKGLSFPVARQAALTNLGFDETILQEPNNILAVEYCKAILLQDSTMSPCAIHRQGSYHDVTADAENPSATAVRNMINAGDPNWLQFVPEAARPIYRTANAHTLAEGERAILARLRCMSAEGFQSLPYGSEGLWRKLMHAVRQKATLEDILAATKSKRYTRTRLDRMVMCAFLGITEEMMNQEAPYVRVLAFNDKGRAILNKARDYGTFPNIGERLDSPWQILEDRCGDLYELFAQDAPGSAGYEARQRVYYCKEKLNH